MWGPDVGQCGTLSRSVARALGCERILGEVGMGRLVTLEDRQATPLSFEPLIDNVAAAELLKIHPKSLQRMARRGEVPAVRIGRYWRFRASQPYQAISECNFRVSRQAI